MKCLIVDGLAETRTEYRKKIFQADKNIECIEAISAEDAFFLVFEQEIDFIVTSEILSFRNAFELALVLQKSKIDIPVIVIAADDSRAIDAIHSNLFGYLIDPVSDAQFKNTIQKAETFVSIKEVKQKKSYKTDTLIRIGTISDYKLINLDTLAYCLAEGSYTNICLTDGTAILSGYYLGRVEKILGNYHFVRINRSAIVNLKLIKLIDKRKDTCQIKYGNTIKEFRITKSTLKKLEENQIL